MLYFALILSGILLLIANVSVRLCGPKSQIPTVLCFFCAGAGFGCLFHPLFCLNSFLVMIALGICAAIGARPSRILLASLGMTLLTYAWFSISSIRPEIEKWSALQEQFPMESMGERLAYEQRRTETLAAPEKEQSGSPNQARLAELENRADELTKNLEYHWRVTGLEQIHAGTIEQFIEARGFGVGRMVLRPTPQMMETLDRSFLERINDRIVDLPDAEPPESGDSTTLGADNPAAAAAMNHHEANVLHFANGNKFGFIRDREHVAGFLPHEFIDRPAGFRSWKIEKLELVSLLKFDEPAVYISKELPKMKDLKDAKTRPLDSFESQALTALRRGDDLQVQSNPDSIRMLGSIRALKQCIKCHSVERGDLLGAFTYKLRPERKSLLSGR